MLMVDLALVIDPIHVGAEFSISFAVVLLDVAGGCFTNDDVAGGGAESSRYFVFL